MLGDDGDAAMTDLLAQHPPNRPPELRQLVRNTFDERNTTNRRAPSASCFGSVDVLVARPALMRMTVTKTATTDQPACVPPTVSSEISSDG